MSPLTSQNQVSGAESYADKNQMLFKAMRWSVNLQLHLHKMEALVQVNTSLSLSLLASC